MPPTPIHIILYDETKIVNKFKVETKNDWPADSIGSTAENTLRLNQVMLDLQMGHKDFLTSHESIHSL